MATLGLHMAVETNVAQDSPHNEPGYALSAGLIGLLVALQVACVVVAPRSGRMGPDRGTVLVGVYIIVWGLMFLGSYYFSHKSIFLRGLVWICEHFSRPAGRDMAFFYFALAVALGSVAVLKGLGLI